MNTNENTKNELMLTEKTAVIHKLHAYAMKRDVTYFAVGMLDRAARNLRPLTDVEIASEWSVGMPRCDFDTFTTDADEYGFTVSDSKLGFLSVSLGGEEILLYPYDALPLSAEERKNFLSQMDEANKAYLLMYKNKDENLDSAYEKLTAFAKRYNGDEDAVMMASLVGKTTPAFNRALVYPTKNKAFYGNAVATTALDTCADVPQQHDVERLAALRALDELCRKHSLPYFAISKLAVGARMYGKLPPDLDTSAIEVGMLRHDRNKLVSLIDPDSKLICFDCARNGAPDGALRIAHADYADVEDVYDNVISVMPYDCLPEEERERREFMDEIKKLSARYNSALNAEPRNEEAVSNAYKSLHTTAQKYNGGEFSDTTRICRIECGQSKTLFFGQVFPTVRLQMNDFEINVPADLYIWSEKSDIDYNRAANAQKTEILKRLIKLCLDHDITYFAIADLLIGAVTYNDYIPSHPTSGWDVALLRTEYEKLLHALRNHDGEYGIKLSEFRDSARRCPKLTKTVSLSTPFYFEGELRLVPFDKIPEGYDTQYAFVRKLNRRNTLIKKLADYESGNPKAISKKELERAKKKYGEEPIMSLYREIDELAQYYNDDDETHLYGRVAHEKSKFIREDDLFPLGKCNFRDTEINCPRDYSVWTPVIDEALHYQVTSIQKADFLLLDKVDEICRKLGIGYFICGGSMLGYMRNGGFIPWDDDIDIGMLRADYDRFINEAEPYLDERFFLQTRKKDPHIPYLFSKLRLNNTEYITEYNERRAFHKGICLDIFPFDFIPNEPGAQEAFKKEVIGLSKVHNRIVNNQKPEPIDPYLPRDLYELYCKGYGILKRTFFKLQSLKKSQKAYIERATYYNDKAEELGLTTVASFVPSYTYIKLDDLLPYQDVLFDGHRARVPRRPDVFLTMQYGDYMQFPPKHNQVSHRLLRWSVDVLADEKKRAEENTTSQDKK